MRVLTLTTIMFAGIGGANAGDLDIRVMLSGQVAPGVYGQVQIGNDRPPPVGRWLGRPECRRPSARRNRPVPRRKACAAAGGVCVRRSDPERKRS